METVIKARLEELVDLMNDPDTTVVEKEVEEKLEKILALVKNPAGIAKERKQMQDKLDEVVKLVSSSSVDPDIEVKYCEGDKSGDPYMLITYIVSEYTQPTRKYHLKGTALRNSSAETLANRITASIGEFKGEIDSVEMG